MYPEFSVHDHKRTVVSSDICLYDIVMYVDGCRKDLYCGMNPNFVLWFIGKTYGCKWQDMTTNEILKQVRV